MKSTQDPRADRSAAGDELRTYLLMLLVGAPVLIGSPVARRFLEQAQALGAEIGSGESVSSPSRRGLIDTGSDRSQPSARSRLYAALISARWVRA